MAPSLHDNYAENNYQLRKKFTQCLETLVKSEEKVVSLRLKSTWDQHSNKLFTEREKRFTPAGWSAYWSSIDKAIQYFDEKLIFNITQNLDRSRQYRFRNIEGGEEHKSSNSTHRFNEGNQRWGRNYLHHGQPTTHRRHDSYNVNHRKLPTPPAKRH